MRTRVGVSVEPTDTPRWRSVRHHRKYHYKYYWKDVAQPLLQEAFDEGGFWTQIFGPDLARAGWLDCIQVADAIAVAHLLPQALGPALARSTAERVLLPNRTQQPTSSAG